MKRFLSLLLVVTMCLYSAYAFAESETDDVTAKVEQSVEDITATEEETAYKEYFNTAFVIVKYTRNVAVNLSNFFYINQQFVKPIPVSDLAFLSSLESPLELTEKQMSTLYNYKSTTESYKDYKSYSSSSLSAAVSLSKTLPAYLTVFTLLEKPVVPEKYAYVDSCIDNAIAEAKLFNENVNNYLNRSRMECPDYNERMYNYLEMVYDLVN